ncbi:MAG: hypothetical protein JWO39_1428 [Gemmatimonadetes bacterium]|nr:hypothetical protein [Gemmatimonadota bacterium]
MADRQAQFAQSLRSNRVIYAILAIGVALRVWQYLADTSMWFDELSIARNITERSLPQLLSQPLGYSQTAPLGFLTVLDISERLFGPGDMSLRLFPFLCGIAGLFLFWRVAERTLEGIAVPVAVALFAISGPLIRYTGELKQYGPDVLVILGLTLVALDLCERTPSVRRCVFAGGVGVLAVFFSQAAVLVLAGVGAALTLRWMLNKDSGVDARRPVFVTVPIWAGAALGGLLIARHYMTPQTMEFMHAFWKSRLGFLPLPPTPAGSVLWARDRFTQFFGPMSGYLLPLLYTAFALSGFFVLRRRRDVALILLGPVAVTFAAAVVQQYPFRTRLVLFLLPTLLLTTAASIDWIVERVSRASRPASAALALAAMIPPVFAVVVTPPPYTVEPFKPVFAYVQAHRQSGDKIYVFSNSFQAMARYGAQYGFSSSSYVNGVCDERSNTPFLVDVDRFRGEPRVWVIGSSVPDWAPSRRAIRKYLGTIGVRRDSMSVPSIAPLSPVSAELYDLSDTSRLRLATATEFHTPADTMHAICHDWVRPTAVVSIAQPR